jgi:YhcH/YjgK/YiaL family protein
LIITYPSFHSNCFIPFRGTKDISEGRWEAHKKYIDVQFVAQGSELFGYASMNNMKEETEYDTEKDVYFLEGNGNFIDLQEGMFGVFFPHDVHMPSISKDKSIKVKKVVVKVKA